MARNFKVVMLVGARQVGKSSLLAHLYPDLKHLTFDPYNDQYGAKADPDQFLKNFPVPLILDEVQYTPSCYRPSRDLLIDLRKKANISSRDLKISVSSKMLQKAWQGAWEFLSSMD